MDLVVDSREKQRRVVGQQCSLARLKNKCYSLILRKKVSRCGKSVAAGKNFAELDMVF